MEGRFSLFITPNGYIIGRKKRGQLGRKVPDMCWQIDRRTIDTKIGIKKNKEAVEIHDRRGSGDTCLACYLLSSDMCTLVFVYYKT